MLASPLLSVSGFIAGFSTSGSTPRKAIALWLDSIAAAIVPYLTSLSPASIGIQSGTVSFVGSVSEPVVFGTMMGSTNYTVVLTPTKEVGTGNIYPCAYGGKMTTGFQIFVGGGFTGDVDWVAIPN